MAPPPYFGRGGGQILNRIARIGPDRDLGCASFDSGGSRSGQAAILGPPYPLAGCDTENILDLSLTDRLARYPEKPFPYGIDEIFRSLPGIRIKDTTFSGFNECSVGTCHQHPNRGITLAAMYTKSERHTHVEID
ncbi:hypothetical protein [Erythrobacter sp. CCH5-A1]|uniref:hypothetical protein n=1 Tax=Erythrobacter sp. CCH5-A1 TaxID=1768792 RepID=UPI000AD661D1|nr:hypothetical protein [Erythrobacter sp. CCH5-A1]